MKTPTPADALRRKYQRLAGQLAKSGWILHGTITARLDTRGNPKAPGKKKARGPYYQWTFKRQGKTVTVNLAAAQAKTFQKAIDNQRKIEETPQKMRTLSRQFMEATTVSPPRRAKTALTP